MWYGNVDLSGVNFDLDGRPCAFPPLNDRVAGATRGGIDAAVSCHSDGNRKRVMQCLRIGLTEKIGAVAATAKEKVVISKPQCPWRGHVHGFSPVESQGHGAVADKQLGSLPGNEVYLRQN